MEPLQNISIHFTGKMPSVKRRNARRGEPVHGEVGGRMRNYDNNRDRAPLIDKRTSKGKVCVLSVSGRQGMIQGQLSKLAQWVPHW